MHKTLTALAAAAALTFAAMGSAVAQHHHGGYHGGYHGHGGYYGGGVAAGIIGGLAAGAILGGIAAQQGYYGDGYYYGSGYYYGPGYYGGPYAYEPAPVYVRPVPRVYRGGNCWIETDSTRGYGYYGPCR